MIKVVLCFITKDAEISINNLKHTFSSYKCIVLNRVRPKYERNTMVQFGICITDYMYRDTIQFYAEQSLGKYVLGVDVVMEGDYTWNSRWSLLL